MLFSLSFPLCIHSLIRPTSITKERTPPSPPRPPTGYEFQFDASSSSGGKSRYNNSIRLAHSSPTHTQRFILLFTANVPWFIITTLHHRRVQIEVQTVQVVKMREHFSHFGLFVVTPSATAVCGQRPFV